MIKVLFFATLRMYSGVREVTVEKTPGLTIADLRRTLGEMYQGLNPSIQVSLAAINREYATDSTEVPDGAEVAFFPPVSGG